MAITGEQPHYSAKTLDLGERAQHLFGGTAPMRWAMRSKTPAYLRLEWFSLPDVDPEDLAWADEVPGDPKAGRLPRNWHNAAILGVSRGDLARLGAHDQVSQHYAKDAVAYEADGVVRVGINPESDHIFGGLTSGENNGDKMLAVAMRLGRGPLKAAMGHYQPDEERLLIPEGIVVLDQSMPVSQIPVHYPNTRLAG
jgi:hypothetical protein